MGKNQNAPSQQEYFTPCAVCGKTFGQLQAWPTETLEALFQLVPDAISFTAAGAMCEPCCADVKRTMMLAELKIVQKAVMVPVRFGSVEEREHLEQTTSTQHVRTVLQYMAARKTLGEAAKALNALRQINPHHVYEIARVMGQKKAEEPTPSVSKASERARATNAEMVHAYLAGTPCGKDNSHHHSAPSQQAEYGDCKKKFQKNGKQGGEAKKDKGKNKKPGRFDRAA